MHHAIETQEILSTIFHHLSPPLKDVNFRIPKPDPTLAVLARTCRAFKEPALNTLWMSLPSVSPLVWCLRPDISRFFNPDCGFGRPLTQMEWDILRSYTRRIRAVGVFPMVIDEESYEILSNPPTTEPLFPNLRYLHCEYARETMSFLHLPFPSLIFLDVMFRDSDVFWNSLNSFPNTSPNISRFRIRILYGAGRGFSAIEPSYVNRWHNLSYVDFPDVALDMRALLHLSRTPTLARLLFTLADPFPASNSPLFFPNLRHLSMASTRLHSISRFLSHSQLPAIMYFSARIEDTPSRRELSSFFTGVLSPNVDHSIKDFRLYQTCSPWDYAHLALLGLEDLQPCMAFGNLHEIRIGLQYSVGLTDNDLLTLASAWPKLQYLYINFYRGWNSQYGITPDGLVRLLQTCRSLNQMTLCLDTRGYTEVPSSHEPKNLGYEGLLDIFAINILDTAIEAECVPALATFFAGIASCCEPYTFFFEYWNSEWMMALPNAEEFKARWRDVWHRIDGIVGSIPSTR